MKPVKSVWMILFALSFLLGSCRYSEIKNEAPAINFVKVNEKFRITLPEDHTKGETWQVKRDENYQAFEDLGSVWHGSLSGQIFLARVDDVGNVLSVQEYGTSVRDEGYSMDGMDATLCKINTEKQSLEYASANNSLYIVSQNELSEYKSQKMPVGYMENTIPFQTFTIQLKKGDVIYTFTDGFADQFGGEKGKKFKYSQLKNKLIEISEKSLTEQKSNLDRTFENWKGHLEQVDDVCVIGVRI